MQPPSGSQAILLPEPVMNRELGNRALQGAAATTSERPRSQIKFLAPSVPAGLLRTHIVTIRLVYFQRTGATEVDIDVAPKLQTVATDTTDERLPPRTGAESPCLPLPCPSRLPSQLIPKATYPS